MTVITRFAPGPTGLLHLGHARAALFAARAARDAGGRFLVRIEDIDRARCRPEFEQAIFEDLAWLGLNWAQPVRRQSEHFADYHAALTRLDRLGVIYPCFCSRKDIAEASGAPHADEERGVIYPGLCRSLPPDQRAERMDSGAPFALRLNVAAALSLTGPVSWTDRSAGVQHVESDRQGDVVLARKDTPTSYHLSVTVDDAVQGITLVTRGLDLLRATDIHRLLQALLGLPVPHYHHHGLLTGADGRRLSKRDGATSIQTLRAAGHTPAAVQAMAGFEAA
ncbi:MAG: tRNA glutamyl-Q(34) synthetase GluQRS [Rhodospirillaceae bacterium]